MAAVDAAAATLEALLEATEATEDALLPVTLIKEEADALAVEYAAAALLDTLEAVITPNEESEEAALL